MKARPIGVMAFDRDRLQRELAAVESLELYSSRDGIEGWSHRILWAGPWASSPPPAHEDLRSSFPYLDALIAAVFATEHIHLVRVFVATAGGYVRPHRDWHGTTPLFTRLHIPLRSDAHCLNSEAGDVYRMQVGEIWYLDGGRPHSGGCFSDTRRVHLVIDFNPDPPLHRLFRDPERYRPFAPAMLVERDRQGPDDLSAIYGLSRIATRKNLPHMLDLLAAVHFDKQVGCAEVYDWLIDIARLTGDPETIRAAARFKAAYVGPHPPDQEGGEVGRGPPVAKPNRIDLGGAAGHGAEHGSGKAPGSRILGRIDLDPARLSAEIATIAGLDMETCRGYSAGDWRKFNAWIRSDQKTSSAKVDLGPALPYLTSIIHRSFDDRLIDTVYFFVAENGGFLLPHRDWARSRPLHVRLHLPLQSDDECFNSEDDALFQMRVGEIWFLDAGRVHSAGCFSQGMRLHLVMDFAPDTSPEDLVADPASRCFRSPRPLANRRKLGDEDLAAIYGLATLASERTFPRLANFLASLHYDREVHCAAVYGWLNEIARRTGNPRLVERAAELEARYIHPFGPSDSAEPP